MYFSSRVGSASLNAVTAAQLEARREGRRLTNLSDSNPTRAGLAPSVVPEIYSAQPQGSLADRELIADFIARTESRTVTPDQLYVLSSTSEAYAWIFKLLCDPGDIVLAPSPGYPLVEQIARLESVQTRYYSLGLPGEWEIDTGQIRELLESSEGERIRAIVAINPNNPTGSYVSADEHERLAQLAAEYSVALIADEVFFDYPLDDRPRQRLAGETGALTFALDGLSKHLAAPGAKVAWIEVSGPSVDVREAQWRLDMIADAYLPMSTLISRELPKLLAAVPEHQEVVRTRCAQNLAALQHLVDKDPHGLATVYAPQGGWSALLRFPASISEDELVTTLIAEQGITVQPGYFFDMSIPGFVSVSLLLEPEEFRRATEQLLATVARLAV